MSTATKTTPDLKAWFFRYKRVERGDPSLTKYTVSQYTAVAQTHDLARAIADLRADQDNAGEYIEDAPAPIGNVRGTEADESGKPVRITGHTRCEIHATFTNERWEGILKGRGE